MNTKNNIIKVFLIVLLLSVGIVYAEDWNLGDVQTFYNVNILGGNISGNGSGLTSFNAANATGVLPNASLPTSAVNKSTTTTNLLDSILNVYYSGVKIFSIVDGYGCESSYCIYQPWYAPSQVYAKKGSTQTIDYSGTDAATIINLATANVDNGGSVIFYPGNYTYYITSTIYINKSMTFGTHFGVMQTDTSQVGVRFVYTGADGGNGIVANCVTPCTSGNKGRVRLQGFAIIGNDTATGIGTGIIINGSTVAGAGLDKTYIEQVASMNWKGNGIQLINAYESSVAHSVFQNNSLDGFLTNTPPNAQTGEFLLEDIRSNSNGRTGINISGGTTWHLDRVSSSLNAINGFNFTASKGVCTSCFAEGDVSKGFHISASTTGWTLISPQVSYPSGATDYGIALTDTTQRVTIINYYGGGATTAKDLYIDVSSNYNTCLDCNLPNGYTDANGGMNSLINGGQFQQTFSFPTGSSPTPLYGINGSAYWTGSSLCIRNASYPAGVYKCVTFT